MACDAPAILARLRALLAQGVSQRQAAQRLSLTPSRVHRLKRRHGLTARPWRLTREERRRIGRLIREGLTPREIAARVARARRTIELLRRHLDERLAARPVEKGAIVFREREERCPVHGRVSVWPCVACAASNHLRSSGRSE